MIHTIVFVVETSLPASAFYDATIRMRDPEPGVPVRYLAVGKVAEIREKAAPRKAKRKGAGR